MSDWDNSQESIEKLARWHGTPLGSALLAAETGLMQQVLDDIFGEHLLQIGRWGDAQGLVRYTRTQHAATVYQFGQGGNVGADLARLPFESNSVDAVVLPHTLDLASHPHDVLREAHRVLRSEGRLLILGFKPFGLWGLRRVWPGASFPPAVHQAIGDRKLRDWLQLLGMRISQHERFFFRFPFDVLGKPPSAHWEDRGRRWWPEMAACYLMNVRKRVLSVTPIRPRWHQRARVVGGVPEPSLRQTLKRIENADKVVTLHPQRH